jgi:group I intron endonuclease
VGSAICLSKRLRTYFSSKALKRLLKGRLSHIYRTILKYDYFNFKLDILEYIDLSNITNIEEKREMILEREQFYIDLLNPSLNINKIAGSMLGYKHTEETKLKMRGKYHTEETKLKISLSLKGNKNSMFGKTFTDETRLKMSISKKGINHPMFNKYHTEETKKKISESIKLYNKFNSNNNNNNIKIKIFDILGNLIKEFSSIRAAAIHFKVSHSTISKVLSRNLLYYGFIFKSEIKDNKMGVYDINNRLIEILNSIKNISDKYNIPQSTLRRYVKLNKLYKNKYYFKKMSN